MVFANVGVHADVEITLTMDRDGGEGATIAFGHTGPDLSIDFCDVDSLQRLAALAADGARQLQERIDANAQVNRHTRQLVGGGGDPMSVDSLGISVDGTDSVHLSASRVDEAACLVIKTDGAHCEIQMDRAGVEALRDQLPAALTGLDRWAAETAGCEKAGAVEQRAVDAATRALDLAMLAEQAGDHKLAASLRKAASTASAQAKAVHDAVTAFEEAAVDADYAADRLIDILGKAETTLGQYRDEDRPAEPVGSCVR